MLNKFILATKQQGMDFIRSKDDFIARLSPAERSMRMCTENIDMNQFISFLKDNVLSWNRKEIARMSRVTKKLGKMLLNLGISLSEEIFLIKTTGKEEWNGAYTRANAIYLPCKKLENYDDERLLMLLLHEFCHVLLRYRADLQRSCYEAAGFVMIDEITLPESLTARKMTNPDAPYINCRIEVGHGGEKFDVVPCILLKKEYETVNTGCDIAESLTMKLLAVENINRMWNVKTEGGKPLLFDVPDVSGFFEQVGRNTDYIIHPEEIIAENFVLLALDVEDVPSPQILLRLKNILAGSALR